MPILHGERSEGRVVAAVAPGVNEIERTGERLPCGRQLPEQRASQRPAVRLTQILPCRKGPRGANVPALFAQHGCGAASEAGAVWRARPTHRRFKEWLRRRCSGGRRGAQRTAAGTGLVVDVGPSLGEALTVQGRHPGDRIEIDLLELVLDLTPDVTGLDHHLARN